MAPRKKKPYRDAYGRFAKRPKPRKKKAGSRAKTGRSSRGSTPRSAAKQKPKSKSRSRRAINHELVLRRFAGATRLSVEESDWSIIPMGEGEEWHSYRIRFAPLPDAGLVKNSLIRGLDSLYAAGYRNRTRVNLDMVLISEDDDDGESAHPVGPRTIVYVNHLASAKDQVAFELETGEFQERYRRLGYFEAVEGIDVIIEEPRWLAQKRRRLAK